MKLSLHHKFKITLSLSLCIMGFIAISSPAMTQAFPPGSYKGTCKDCQLNNDTLSCSCVEKETRTGRTHMITHSKTSLPEANKCKQDIANCRGTLKCGPC